MAPVKRRGGAMKLSPRAFYTTVLIFSCLAVWSFLLRPSQLRNQLSGRLIQLEEGPVLVSRSSSSKECREVRDALDQCAFVTENCQDDEAGLLSYLTFYYCGFGHARGIAFIILVSWLGLLFTTIGIAASDFFSVNLSTIASILGLSESLAGVTFLAFGNGSPDVFSTFAAMGSNSASMAVGELIGAASFITAVVAGSMALIREFKVSKKTYVRDICFFIVAVVFTMCFLADGHLHLWECMAMIGYYLFYVVAVVGWHWYMTRRKRRRARLAAARGHVYGAVGHPNDELAPEPFRDDPDDVDGNVGGATGSSSEVDVSALEAAPRIEIDSPEATAPISIDEDDEDRGLQVAAEMASSMRVLRPRGRRSTTITPIRPSLVGALEFRSALAQLQKESNLRLRSMSLRPAHVRAYSDHHIEGIHSDSATAVGVSVEGSSWRSAPAPRHGEPSGRNRALSTNDVPPPINYLPPPALDDGRGAASGASTPGTNQRQEERTRSPSPAFQIGGNLAPPPLDPGVSRADTTRFEPLRPPASPRLPQLVMPVTRGSGSTADHTEPTTPFPALPTVMDSPPLLTPNPQADRADFFASPGLTRLEAPFPPLPMLESKPVRWWPYSVLPPPHILKATLFPTLQGWNQKTHWDKFISAISLPSILLLVITLPVVETDIPDDRSEETIIADPPRRGELGRTASVVSAVHDAFIEPETEWQRYRRRTQSQSISGRSTEQPSPALISMDSAAVSPRQVPVDNVSGERPQDSSQVKTVPLTLAPASDGVTTNDDINLCWNRWLVVLQLFMGPLFAVVIFWANSVEELENPGRALVRMILYTLLGSSVALAILFLTTTPDRRPKYHVLLCFLGFIISIAWISTIAGEVVGVLKAFGVILGISEALLGLTIFAAGNSVGDLIADITVARLGYPVMALSACFGGPMLNILLGIGIGGAWMMTQAANHRKKKHPDRPVKYKPYKIRIDGTLMISAVILLITLILLLVVVPVNKWMMTRKIGYSLIALWTVGTIVNVVIEVTGVWSEISVGQL